MGCYPPLDKIVSKALGKCNGRDRWRRERLDYALAYPPTEIHYMRPVARTVTFASNDSVYVIPPSPPLPQPPQQKQSPPEPQQPETPPQHVPEPEPEQHHDAPQPQPQPQPQPEEQPAEPPAQTQDDAPPQAEPKPPKAPKRGKKKKSGRVRFGPDPPPPAPQQEEEEQPQQEEEHAQDPGKRSSGNDAPGQQGPPGAAPSPAPAQPQVPGYLLRYTPSPLPRWEATPRRHEYFSGEYRSYYPTPVREGIYRIATDANRLTTIFSEENPNACTIV